MSDTLVKLATLKGLRRHAIDLKPSQPFRVANRQNRTLIPQGFKANPGLEFANTFGVSKLSNYQ
jgi:hypothetical protein